MSGRFVVECVWGGYVSSQSRTCHVSVETKKRAEAIGKITGIAFADGTSMSVSVRRAKPREKVTERRGYSELLADFVRLGKTGFCHVSDLIKVTP